MDLMESGQFYVDVGLFEINLQYDWFMFCGSLGMLKDICCILDVKGFKEFCYGE